MYERLEFWRQKLLDTGKRNRLLNFRESGRSTLRITWPEPEKLFRMMVSGRRLMISESPVSAPGQTDCIIAESADISELTKTLYNLRMKARSSIEDTGANILFLAFGFIEWTDPQKNRIKSPLMLVPAELRRETLISPYSLSMFEDEIIVNPTLRYKMESDYGIILPLFNELEGGDPGLQELLQAVRLKISHKKSSWLISDEVQLSLFSFLNINMYLDLKENEAYITENPIIRALCGDTSGLPPLPAEIADPTALDRFVRPHETFQVADADSSQQLAVRAAVNGMSFVLQGPPGTGKSQTITNIIAECMAAGKKILFVSEKMAALEVVYRNLKKAGLDEFCLQLHSHKANKYEVVRALSSVLKKPVSQSTEGDAAAAASAGEELDRLREYLNRYAAFLHEKIEPLGKSLYQVHGEIESLKDYPDIRYKAGTGDAGAISMQYIEHGEKLIRRYISGISKMGTDPEANCYYGFNKTGVTFEMQKDIQDRFRVFAGLLEGAMRLEAETGKLLDHEGSEMLMLFGTLKGVKKLASIMSLVSAAPIMPEKAAALFEAEAVEFTEKASADAAAVLLHDFNSRYEAFSGLRKRLAAIYDEDIFAIDAEAMLRRFKGRFSSPFRIADPGYRKDRILLKQLASDIKYRFGYADAMEHIDLARKALQLKKEAKLMAAGLISMPCYGQYLAEAGDNDDIFHERAKMAEALLKWASDLRRELQSCEAGDGGTNKLEHQILRKIWGSDGSDNDRHFRKESGRLAGLLANIFSRMETEILFIRPLFDEERFDIDKEKLEALKDKFGKASLEDEIHRLPDWINFIKTENECSEHGLSQFLDEVICEGIQPDIWTYVYRKRLYLLWLDSMYARDDVFSDFRRETYEAMIGDFRELDKSQLVISRKRIREILEALRPQASQFASGGSEIHVLMREAEKRRRLLPVRQLFGKIPLLLTALKPCLLMSPLSVSLYLDPGLYTFDTVIFDEASQVCTENAIGAIYRGKQLIVVGDREQLPPSDFFRATAAVPSDDGYDTGEEQAFDERGAYESILDECGSILSRLSLKWHYRSRHEHLIAYSNAMIYKDLITFPSPVVNSKDLGVEFVYVKDGVYDRSASRTNPAEAKKAAELVFECLENYPGRSVGVVAFSEAQQMAIDEEINKLRKVNGSFEKYFNNVFDIAGGGSAGGGNAGRSACSEGFFVKNLENVQGDERDTIIFSVGYGKDRNGKMSMYFGPLNREGGYRRLNVAITRARINVKLICSFLPEDIDIGRTDAAGVAMLKGYIDFAMNGTLPGTGGSARENTFSEGSCLFEREIFEFIRVNGFDADFKAGCSEYKIDIAVKHPSDKAKYMLAVECDGEVYNSAVTARERDRLRYEVMSARGWKLYRVWSTAWIRNNASEKDLLLKALRDAAAEN